MRTPTIDITVQSLANEGEMLHSDLIGGECQGSILEGRVMKRLRVVIGPNVDYFIM